MKFEFNVKNLSTEEIERLESVRSEFVNRKRQLINKNSKAESHFEKLLNDAHIYHEREKCFYDCKGEWCYIDFYIPLYHLAIEIDGKEHRTQKQSFRDKNKEEFLTYNRNIATVRITNEQCLAMKQINLADFVYHPKVKQSIAVRIKSLFRHEGEHNSVYKKHGIDITRKVYVYNKTNGATYIFKSAYSFHMSLGCNYEQFIHIMTNIADPFSNPKFIIGYTEKELNRYKTIFYENNGIKPNGFIPVQLSNEVLPAPIFQNYPKRRFLVAVETSAVRNKCHVRYFVITMTIIDIDTMEKVYVRNRKYYWDDGSMTEVETFTDCLAKELELMPFNSDVCVIAFNWKYIKYINQCMYKLSNGHRGEIIDNIIKSRGISLKSRNGDMGDVKYCSKKIHRRAYTSVAAQTKLSIEDFYVYLKNYQGIPLNCTDFFNIYNNIENDGWNYTSKGRSNTFDSYVINVIKNYEESIGRKIIPPKHYLVY